MKKIKVRRYKIASPLGGKKATILIILLLVSVVGLELFNIFLSNRVSTDSIEANQLQKDIALYTQKNNVLKSKVYEFASFDSVASRAAEFGFAKATGSITLDAPVQVARQ